MATIVYDEIYLLFFFVFLYIYGKTVIVQWNFQIIRGLLVKMNFYYGSC